MTHCHHRLGYPTTVLHGVASHFRHNISPNISPCYYLLTYREHNRTAHTCTNSGYQVLLSDFTERLGTRLLDNCESQNAGMQNKSSKFMVKFARSSNNPYQPYPGLSLSSFRLVCDRSLDLTQVRLMMTSEEHMAAIPRFLMLVYMSASPVRETSALLRADYNHWTGLVD